jgi:hypothetical protein
MTDEPDPLEVLRAMLAISPEDAEDIRADANEKADPEPGPDRLGTNRPKGDG